MAENSQYTRIKQKDLRPRKMAAMSRVESRSKDTHDTMESFRFFA